MWTRVGVDEWGVVRMEGTLYRFMRAKGVASYSPFHLVAHVGGGGNMERLLKPHPSQ